MEAPHGGDGVRIRLEASNWTVIHSQVFIEPRNVLDAVPTVVTESACIPAHLQLTS